MDRMRFIGRTAFETILAQQLESHAQPIELDARWLGQRDLERSLVGEGAVVDADFALVLSDWIPRLIEDGQILPLDDFIAEDPPEGWPDAWAPEVRAVHAPHEQQVFAMPYHGTPVVLLYREDLFNDRSHQRAFEARFGYPLAVPTTWDRFLDVCVHFNEPSAGFYGTALSGFPDGHNNVYDFLTHLWSRGGHLLDDAGPSFASAEGRDALQFLHALWQQHGVIDPQGLGWDSGGSGMAFAEGNAAMTVNWAGFEGLSASEDSPTHGRIQVAPIPRSKEVDGRAPHLAVYWSMVIPTRSAKPELAWALLKHLASPEMDRLTSLEGGAGVRRSTWNDPAVRLVASFYEGLEDLQSSVENPPSIACWPEVCSSLSQMVDDVINNRRSVDDALERATGEIAELLVPGATSGLP